MSWTNYHNHSHYDDGKNTIKEHVLGAIEHNVVSLGFSGHCPVAFKNRWCMKKEDLPQYFQDIDDVKAKYQNEIQIYKSMEIDYIPGIVSPSDPWIKGLNLDYRIGSVHFTGFYEDGSPGEVDSTHQKFLHGLEHIFHGDVKALVKTFFALNRKMVCETLPDIIGHFDKIKIHNHGLWDESAEWYRNEILTTLEEIKSAGTIVEINTRGIYKNLTRETYPGQWVLKHLYQMEIPVQINSDAHVPREITRNFDETLSMILNLGFKKVKVRVDNEWGFVHIDNNGLKM